MEKIEFKSQICTTKEQSERLLALGLKKETADITLHYERSTEDYKLQDIPFSRIMHLRGLLNKRPILGRSGDDLYAKDIPAWSLHRLMLLYDKTIEFEDWNLNEAYEHIMILIEDAIRGGIFNTQFLEDKQ